MVPRPLQFVRLTLALSLLSSSSAFADTVFFTDRAAWQLAAGGTVATDTFESYPWNGAAGNNLGVSATLNGVTYAVENDELFGNDSDAITYDNAYVSGQYLEWQNHSPNVLHVTLPVNATAIGFDYGQFYGTIQPFLVSLGNGDTASRRTLAHHYAFFGAVSTEPLTRFSLTSPEFPLIDNLSYARTSPVPEPGSRLLFATGLGAVCRRVWKRSNRPAWQPTP